MKEQLNMPDEPKPNDDAQKNDGATGTSGDTGTTDDTPPATGDENPAGADALGDAGKKALDAMKADRNKAREEANALRAEFEAFKAKAEGKEAEHAAAVEAQRVKDEALAAANERILKADIRTAAKGKLNDPNDAFRYPEDIDLSAFEADANGEYDAAAIAAAIDRLIEKKPYLAAQGGKKFQGSADGGARNDAAKSIDDQIAEATKAGNHRLAIQLKRQKAYAPNA